ncbi:MAG: efflux transporter outer membrane subunit [Planctomycetota bacterium]
MITAALFASACLMGPEYERPELPEAEEYRASTTEGESIANLPWWEIYEDETLRELIAEALENNNDLRASLARIAEARAVVGVAASELYPQLGVGAAGGLGARTSDGGPSDSTGDVALIGSAFYQVDLWGRIRRGKEAAVRSMLATEESYRTVTISIVAAVARSYFVLRDLDNRLEVSRRTAETRRESLEAMQVRFDAGAISEVDLNQAQIQFARAEGTVQSLVRAVEQAENGISVLLGRVPTEIPRGGSLYDQVALPAVPAGLPSELLERRPDVLGAELRLAAQTSRIGVAEASRFPSLDLTAALGAQTAQLTDMSVTNSFIDVGFDVFAPLFTGGLLKSNVDIERARTEALAADYEQTVLVAFREVEDALIAVQTFREEYLAAQREVAAASNAVDIAWIRYEDGLTSFLEYLQVERDLFNAELRRSQIYQGQLNSVVDLYEALGGGWSVVEDEEEEAGEEESGADEDAAAEEPAGDDEGGD